MTVLPPNPAAGEVTAPDASRRQSWERPFSSFRALAAFGRDLTEEARQGQLDPVIGREAEMGRLMQVLARRAKNTPVLVGHAGVGKTAIVEGLAQRIAAGGVPNQLRYTRIVALDLAALVAGARARGQFEERLQAVMEEVAGAERGILLFVDEVHAIVGAGASEGGFDFAGMVKPALARGALRLIGATTPDEYRRYIERDPALERRLTPVWVAEPAPAHALAILHGLRPRFEAHHGVPVTDEALAAAVRLSTRYLGGRRLPDKAIDLIDEAAARVALRAGWPAPDPLTDGNRSRGMDANAGVDGTTAASAVGAAPRGGAEPPDKRDAAVDGAAGDAHAASAALEPPENDDSTVGEAEIAGLIAAMTGIPVSRVREDEAQRLLRLEERLERRVVGQRRAVRLLSETVRRARSGLGDPRRPWGSFVFLGPSGVGKTELARALAEALFDDADALLRLDMSEYMERHNVARLFGAPPGYVGYDDAGALTEQVRRRPYQVILFDEIEKAHPDVWGVLLQVLDAGRMTDGHGRVVDFRNTVVIMTSNLGASDEGDARRLLRAADGSYDRDWLERRTEEALRATFRPEFRNRIDEVIVFEPLGERELHAIVDLQLAEVRGALALRGLGLEISHALRRALIAEGFSPAFGARPLRRTLQRRLVNPLAAHVLTSDLASGDVLIGGYRNGRLRLRVRRSGDRPAQAGRAVTGPMSAVVAAEAVRRAAMAPPAPAMSDPPAAGLAGDAADEDLPSFFI